MSLLKNDKRAADVLEVMESAKKEWEDGCLQVEKEIDAANAKIAEIKEALGDAAEANDLTAFQAETAKLVSAETTLQMAEMRFNRMMDAGFADEKTIDAGIRIYETQVAQINAKACKAIFDAMNTLIQTVDAANKEAMQALKKEKDLCKLCGVEFRPSAGDPALLGHAIFAHSFLNSFLRIRQNSDLCRFASRAHNG